MCIHLLFCASEYFNVFGFVHLCSKIVRFAVHGQKIKYGQRVPKLQVKAKIRHH